MINDINDDINDDITDDITQQILKDKSRCPSYEDACALAGLSDKHTLDLIFCANKIRETFKKDRVFTCAIINAKSGSCSEDCAFCAQSAHHRTGVDTYPLLTGPELIENAVRMQEAGATNYSMVTSGPRLSPGEIDTIGRAAEEIKKETDMTVCASLGSLTGQQAQQLKESGITNYHHNLETARSFFDQICTTHEYDDDIQTLAHARASGMRICSGGILGMGETWEQRVELAVTLRELEVDSIPLNFLNPIPGTRLAGRPLTPPMEALKSISLFRFVNPDRDITICGGREVALKDFQSWIFAAGANGVMVGNYLTTKGRGIEEDMDMIREQALTCRTR
jgi:biotin synthase